MSRVITDYASVTSHAYLMRATSIKIYLSNPTGGGDQEVIGRD